MNSGKKPHIVLVVARGEAVRNFIYSETLKEISQNAKVTLLSLVDHGEVMEHARQYVEAIIPLKSYREKSLVAFFRDVVHTAHYQWLWTEAVKYYWGRHNQRVKGDLYETLKLYSWRFFGRLLASKTMLRLATHMERWLSWHFRPTRDFDKLFREINPDLVFNCSHIHGRQADLPMRVAAGMGIPTAVFVFSWDNLTSRSRIFPPYDHFLMWNGGMQKQLLGMYHPEILPEQVHVTGTPQFDFHFNPSFHWDWETLCTEIGLDPSRPYILYTTGMASDFPEEHRIVAEVIRYLKGSDHSPKPQLVVRTYIKGTSEGMISLANKYKSDSDIIFPPILWDKQWVMPLHHDLYVYTNLLRHAALGINTASTVSLELMMLGKPAINLGFEPPDTNLPKWTRFARHIDYEHYRPIAASGGVMVAHSLNELMEYLDLSLIDPQISVIQGREFMHQMMGDTLNMNSGKRVANLLTNIAKS